jgi:CheY-like chemotaxis protein
VRIRTPRTHRALAPHSRALRKPDFGLFLVSVRAGVRHRSCSLPGEAVMKTILVVDDDAGVRGLLKRVIGDMGYSVVEAGDALSALEVLQTSEVSLALVDIRMPGRDGVWLVDQIVTRFPTVPVAVATGLQEMDPHVTLRSGVIGYVMKPFRRSDITDVIRAALRATPAAPPAKSMDLTAFDLM